VSQPGIQFFAERFPFGTSCTCLVCFICSGIIMQSSWTPHYAFCLSVRLSVFPTGFYLKTKTAHESPKLVWTFPRAGATGVFILQLKNQRSRSLDVRKSRYHNYLAWSRVVRDLLCCQRLRRLAAGRTAAYHVGTRRRHRFLVVRCRRRSASRNASQLTRNIFMGLFRFLSDVFVAIKNIWKSFVRIISLLLRFDSSRSVSSGFDCSVRWHSDTASVNDIYNVHQ